jgi:hypothetical protein
MRFAHQLDVLLSAEIISRRKLGLLPRDWRECPDFLASAVKEEMNGVKRYSANCVTVLSRTFLKPSSTSTSHALLQQKDSRSHNTQPASQHGKQICRRYLRYTNAM